MTRGRAAKRIERIRFGNLHSPPTSADHFCVSVGTPGPGGGVRQLDNIRRARALSFILSASDVRLRAICSRVQDAVSCHYARPPAGENELTSGHLTFQSAFSAAANDRRSRTYMAHGPGMNREILPRRNDLLRPISPWPWRPALSLGFAVCFLGRLHAVRVFLLIAKMQRVRALARGLLPR